MVRLLRPNRPQPRNYFSRREQWRILLLVSALGLVILAMREVRQPETVDRLAQVFAAEGAPTTSDMSATISSTAGASSPPALSSESLGTIRDNTYFRAAEKDAWFALISKLQQTDAAELKNRSVGELGYAQLAQQPNAYRAKVVTVRGTARQVTEEKPAENDLGLKSYYRLVIQPSGGEIWPIFVYALQLPADFPQGEKIAVEVSATGFFFKDLSYQWQDGVGIAPVVLAKEVTRLDTTSKAPTVESRPPVVADIWQKTESRAGGSPEIPSADLNQLLSLAGWDAQRWATFTDDKPLTPDQRQSLVQLLWRLRTFDTVSIAAWTRTEVSLAAIAAKPADYRGQFVRLSGRVRRLVQHKLSAADAERLEMPRYFECDLVLDKNAGIATVLTPRVPQSWIAEFGSDSMDEPATVAGLFVQLLPAEAGRPHVLLVAQQVAADSFARSTLKILGMDVGLLDGIRNHQTILGSERNAFYELLATMGEVRVHELIGRARQNLPLVAKAWQADLNARDVQRRRLAQEVTQRAADGKFSVAPLFNDADRQIGQLIAVDGIARRIVRVDANAESESGAPNDVAQQLGIDHYYEMEVFTDDSQNRPLVFCVRELPPGMPTGSDLREPVRVAGFFLKSWRYRTRDSGQTGDGTDAQGKKLIAPLLIGRGPVRIEVEQGSGHTAELVGGGLFVLALVGIWAVAWWFARGDRRFRQRTAAANFSLPPGQSLDTLNVPPVGEPMNIAGRSTTDTRNSP